MKRKKKKKQKKDIDLEYDSSHKAFFSTLTCYFSFRWQLEITLLLCYGWDFIFLFRKY